MPRQPMLPEMVNRHDLGQRPVKGMSGAKSGRPNHIHRFCSEARGHLGRPAHETFAANMYHLNGARAQRAKRLK